MERVTGLEPATVCLEGRHSSQLSYTRNSNVEYIIQNAELIANHFILNSKFSILNSYLGLAGLEPATNRL